MAHLDLGQSNSELLRVVGHLGMRFHAGLVGIAARQPLRLVFGGGYDFAEAMAASQDELEGELRTAEAQFRDALKDSGSALQWRSSYTTDALPYYLGSEARCADLVVATVAAADPLDSARHTSIGDLVMRVGRPVLVVPLKGARVPFERIVLAWKDTREARRAAVDALPLMALAQQVTVVEIAHKADLPTALGRVQDVADWLTRHNVRATSLALPSDGEDASRLNAILAERDTDLVVAGAYGHSRVREWAFGGMTRSMLYGTRCALLSH